MIEITMEGQLEKESERNSFSELLKSISEQHQVKFEDYDTLVVFEICPEGTIECSYEGKFISIVAQTNVAGPGFHACVARIYDDILMQSGISFEVQDPTQYYENRDFEALKYKYFYPWLRTIAEHIIDSRNQDTNICICWPMDEYQPKGRKGCVVTPMGYMNIDDFVEKDIETIAESFFIWNHERRDAAYYRNCAYSLLWKECYFEYSLMNDYTEKMANTILDYMEAAYEADSLIELPYAIYEQLCETLNREPLLHGDQQAQTIGYRRETVFYPMSHWRIPCDGFCEQTYDRVTESLHLMAPYVHAQMPWEWLMSYSEKDSEDHQAYESLIHACEETFVIEGHSIQGKGCIEQVEDYYMLYAVLHKKHDTLYVQGVIRHQNDVEKIKQSLNQIHHVTNETPQIKN